MNEDQVRGLLERVAGKKMSIDEAVGELKVMPFQCLPGARVDSHRALRCGFPEVIFCQGKRPADIEAISRAILGGSDRLLATRADREAFRALAREHASDLVALGVDHVIVGAVEFPSLCGGAQDCNNYAWVYRPIEVLFREWKALRDQGVPTPQVAVWADVPPGDGANMYRALLKLCDKYRDSGLVLTDRSDPLRPRPLFLIRDATGIDGLPPPNENASPDETKVQEIEARGYTVVRMWGDDWAGLGRWSFQAPCRSGDKNATQIVGMASCGQRYTTCTATGAFSPAADPCQSAAPLGLQLAVNPSYQTLYSSASLYAAGRLDGLTYAKQFQRALEVRPDYLSASFWNEHVGAPEALSPGLQANPYFYPMGLEHDTSLPDGRRHFVDLFGSEYTRDLEPVFVPGTAEIDRSMYDLAASCLRVYRSGASACTDAREACCTKLASQRYKNLYSLTYADDYLLTDNEGEKDYWTRVVPIAREICSHGDGRTKFCTTGDPGQPGLHLDNEETGLTPPLVVFAEDGPQRRPIYRCHTGRAHMISIDPGCEGFRPEGGGPLGYVSTVRTTETPRELHRCYSTLTGTHRHTIGRDTAGRPVCPSGYGLDDMTFGYVR